MTGTSQTGAAPDVKVMPRLMRFGHLQSVSLLGSRPFAAAMSPLKRAIPAEWLTAWHALQGGLRQKSQAMQFERMTNLGRVADRRQ